MKPPIHVARPGLTKAPNARESARSRALAGPLLLALGTGAAACVGGIGDPDSLDPAGTTLPEQPAIYEPAEAVLPRLTTLQYRTTLVDLFGPNVPVLATEADTNPYLFDSIGAASTTLSELGVEQYEQAAEAATQYVFSDPLRRAVFVGCEPAAVAADPCTTTFLARFGRRALRRPLAPAELERWSGVAVALSQPDVWEGLRLATAGLLQSPKFLYRVELGEPDPDDPDKRVLTGYEMASRLSFFLWNTTPDEALLDAAAAGELSHQDGIGKHATRLLADERARATIQRYFAQYLDLGRLDGVARDPASYPLFTPTMNASMRTEVELLISHIVDEGADARTIFSTQHTFVNSDLAALYGVEAPGADVTTFVPVDLPEDGPRAGLLTLGAFLTMNAHETQTSPTARGKYVRERVLCQLVQPPPPNIDANLEPPSDGTAKTVRELLEEHRKNEACKGCHSFIDPPGFLFEHFDSIGTYRDKLPGDLPVDATGDLDGVALDGARDLAELLTTDKRVGRCMVTQLYRHAQSRLEEDGEIPAIDQLDAAFAETGYDFRALLLELVTHQAFRTVRAPEMAQ